MKANINVKSTETQMYRHAHKNIPLNILLVKSSEILNVLVTNITVLVNQYLGTHFWNNKRTTARTYYEALHYTIFSNLLSLPPSQICILSFAPSLKRNSMKASLQILCGKNSVLKVLVLVTTKESYFPLNFSIKSLSVGYAQINAVLDGLMVNITFHSC
jgi:hypothetical protein